MCNLSDSFLAVNSMSIHVNDFIPLKLLTNTRDKDTEYWKGSWHDRDKTLTSMYVKSTVRASDMELRK
ncbi:unnamed protein product [Schistosoma rodhaini]|nr:unnamed protein product [Schistosoma rodhaini]